MRHRRKLDINRLGRYVLGGCVVASVPAAVALAFFGSQFAGLSRAAMDAAQVGRHLARGEGFTTSVLVPAAVGRHEGRSPQPDFANPPIHPIGLALLLRLVHPAPGRAADNAVALWTVLWWLLSIGLTWAFSARLFGIRSAIITLIALALNVSLLKAAISGDATAPLTFLVTLLLFAMYELGKKGTEPPNAGVRGPPPAHRVPEERLRPLFRRAARVAAPAIWGAIAGLCFLTDYGFVAVIVGVAGFVLLMEGPARVRSCVIALASLLLVASPWLIRNQVVWGNPVATLRWYGPLLGLPGEAGHGLIRSAAPPSAAAALSSQFGAVLRSGLGNLAAVRDLTFEDADVYVVGVFLAAALVPFPDAALNKLRTVLYIMLAAAALVVALGGAAVGMTPFFPAIYIVAVGFFVDRLERLRVGISLRKNRRISSATMRWLITCAALVLLIVPLLVQLRRGSRLSEWRAGPYARVAEDVPASAVVLTDIPEELAWRADRKALLIPFPPTESELQSIERKVGPVTHSILRKPRHLAQADREALLTWPSAPARPGPRLGYRLPEPFYPGGVLYDLVLKKVTREPASPR